MPEIDEGLDALVARDDVRRLVHLNLSPRQAQVFLYLFRFTEANGFQPSMQMVATALGKAHATSVVGHLKALVRKGWIDRDCGSWRSIRFARTPTGARFRGLVALEPDLPPIAPIPTPEERTNSKCS